MNSNNTIAQDFKIGIFVLITVGIAIAGFFRLQSPEKQEGKLIHVRFGYVAGLAQGAPVSLSGVTIGEVHRIKVVKEKETIEVDVELLLFQSEYVQPNSEFRISSKGLLGSKFIEIFPGESASEMTSESNGYEGNDPVVFERVLETGDRIAIKMEKTVDAVNRLIANDEFRDNLQQNAENISRLIVELRQTSALMNELLSNLRDGKGTLGKLITDEVIYNDLAEFVADIKQHPWKLFKKR